MRHRIATYWPTWQTDSVYACVSLAHVVVIGTLTFQMRQVRFPVILLAILLVLIPILWYAAAQIRPHLHPWVRREAPTYPWRRVALHLAWILAMYLFVILMAWHQGIPW